MFADLAHSDSESDADSGAEFDSEPELGSDRRLGADAGFERRSEFSGYVFGSDFERESAGA